MKYINTCLVLCCLLVLAACTDKEDKKEITPPEDTTLTLESPSSITLDAGNLEASISFRSSTSWTATVPSVATWCHLSDTYGEAGAISLWVVVEPNEGYDDRNAKITVKAGDKSFDVFVVQKQKNAITATSDRFEVGEEGKVIAVEIKSNVSYAYEVSPEASLWIKPTTADAASTNSGQVVVTRAMKTETLYFQVAANPDSEPRTGEIVFYGSIEEGAYAEEVVTIYQAEGSVVMLGERRRSVKSEGGELRVDLSSNVEFEVKMPSAEWIKLQTETSRAVSSQTIYFTVLPNETYETREAEIIFFKKGNPKVADTLTVSQAELEAIIITNREVQIDEAGGVIEVEVNANVDTQVIIESRFESWIEEVPANTYCTRALTVGKRYFRIAPNTNYEQRKGEIIIGKAGDPRSLMDVLTVTQGKNRVLELSQKDYDVRAEGGNIILNVVTNLDYTVILPEWIHQTNTRTRASIIRPQLRFTIDAYPGYNQEDRLGLIILKDKESEFADTVKVTQHGRLQKTYHVATAGTLPELIGDADKNRINALVLTGKLNGTDIRYIREMAGRDYQGLEREEGSLTDLDISEVEIVEGGTPYYFSSSWGGGFYTANKGAGSTEDTYNGTKRFFNEGLGPHAFQSTRLIRMKCPKNIEVIGDFCFDGSATLFSITMYEGLKTIGNSAFESAANAKSMLQDCIIPSTVTSIGNSAFYGCSALKSLVFPAGITKIENNTCASCYSLETVSIPEGVTVIEKDAFKKCSALKDVKLPSTLLELGRDVFEKCTSLTSIDIPYGIKEIQGWANGGGYYYGTFNECTSLKSVTIPSSVERIGDAAFRSTALKSVDIPSSVVSIGAGAFQYSKLTSVTFREGLQKIGSGAFSNTDLAVIHLPSTIETLLDRAFNCESLKEVHVKATLPPEVKGSSAFSNYETCILYVPKGCKAAYQADPSWAAFVHIEEE